MSQDDKLPFQLQISRQISFFIVKAVKANHFLFHYKHYIYQNFVNIILQKILTDYLENLKLTMKGHLQPLKKTVDRERAAA